jgi:hypothetical protein
MFFNAYLTKKLRNIDFCNIYVIYLNQKVPLINRAGHFRYKYRYFDIRYLSDTEKSIEISDLKSIGVSCIVLQTFTSDIRYSYVYR